MNEKLPHVKVSRGGQVDREIRNEQKKRSVVSWKPRDKMLEKGRSWQLHRKLPNHEMTWLSI